MAAIFVGEEPKSCDPAVSEWGNPLRFAKKRIRNIFPKGKKVRIRGIPSELKHLSRMRKRNHMRFRK